MKPYGIDEAWGLVREFHRRLGFPVQEAAAPLTPARLKARGAWMLEELVELLEGQTLADQVDALLDLIYLALGTLVEMGVRPGPLFEMIHEANMAKSPSPDGTGKAIKGPGWQGPEEAIRRALAGQAGRGDSEAGK